MPADPTEIASLRCFWSLHGWLAEDADLRRRVPVAKKTSSSMVQPKDAVGADEYCIANLNTVLNGGADYRVVAHDDLLTERYGLTLGIPEVPSARARQT
jgi:hypothetical protein